MSNSLLNYHIKDGQPNGRDSTLDEIADYYGDMLLNNEYLKTSFIQELIETEQEYPGDDVPLNLKIILSEIITKNDVNLLIELLRVFVRTTKGSLLKRLKNLVEENRG